MTAAVVTRIDAARALHAPCPDGCGQCHECLKPHPCPTSNLLNPTPIGARS